MSSAPLLYSFNQLLVGKGTRVSKWCVVLLKQVLPTLSLSLGSGCRPPRPEWDVARDSNFSSTDCEQPPPAPQLRGLSSEPCLARVSSVSAGCSENEFASALSRSQNACVRLLEFECGRA